MNRREWVVAAILVLVGIGFLTIARLGFSNDSMSGMMGSGPSDMTGYSFSFVLMLVVVTVALFLFIVCYRGKTKKCRNCHAVIHDDWKVCPHCGEPID